MKLTTQFLSGCASAAMIVFAIPTMVAGGPQCAAAEPAAASDGQANVLLHRIQVDSQRLLDHTDKLQTFARDPELTWHASADQMVALRHEVNDLGAKLCRLETMRNVLPPAEQNDIDQIAATAQLLAAHTENTIAFLDGHEHELWLARYRKDTENLYDVAHNLVHSVDNTVEYATASNSQYPGLYANSRPVH